ncbi:hypothetical protein CPB86DRAFT_820103 [Serendipita vermifera]|nr:hypothetical protein CPB86DRAFT_820103 [Serendipita vermifera]
MAQIKVHENAGFGLVTAIWILWQEGSLEECPLNWIASQTEHLLAATRFTTTTGRGLDEPVTANSPNMDDHEENMLSTRLIDSPRPVTFVAVPTPTPPSMRIATPIASRTTINFYDKYTTTLWSKQPCEHYGNIVQPSVPGTETTPQVQGDDNLKPGSGFRMTTISVGASTTLTIVTEIPLRVDPIKSNPETFVVLGRNCSLDLQSRSFILDTMIPYGGPPTAAIGAFVGSLLGVATLWTLLVVWLKRRRKVHGLKELEDVTSNKSSAETNGITSFVFPVPELHNQSTPIPNDDSCKKCHVLFLQGCRDLTGTAKRPNQKAPEVRDYERLGKFGTVAVSVDDLVFPPFYKSTSPPLTLQEDEVSLLPEYYSHSDDLHSGLIFKDTTVELASRDDRFLTDSAHLVLELNQNGKLIDKADLLARESMPGVWDADQTLILRRELAGEFTLSVLIQLGQNDPQLVGSMGLNGTELLDMVGTQFEIPLLSQENYPGILLRTKVSTIEGLGENPREVNSGTNRQSGGSSEVDTIKRMFSDGIAAFHDFGSRGTLESLEQAISNFEAIAELIPEGDPNLPGILSNLGVFLLYRFERLGRILDINDSIERLEKAAVLMVDNDVDKPGCLTNLGLSLQARFRRFGEVADINSAIAYKRAAIEFTPDGHPHKSACLNNLGSSFETRFQRFGEVADIDSAIVNQQVAVELTPDGHPHKPSCLNNLGVSLQTRFERFGEVADIDSAIVHKEAAVGLIPDGHPDKPGHLNNLGVSLHIRFERLGEVTDIDSAIVNQQAAVELTPDGHPHKPSRLNNLGSSLRIRFERFGEVADIDSAIVNQQAAIELTPDGHPDKPSRLNNLGISQRTRFEWFGEVGDIDSAIIHKQAAVGLTPDGDPHKSGCLNNLGLSLQIRFQRFGEVADIDDAIKQQRAANPLSSPP